MYTILAFSRLCFQCPPRIKCRYIAATKPKEPQPYIPHRGNNTLHQLFVHL